jgi:hypothetical protein
MITSFAKIVSTVQDHSRTDAEATAVLAVLLGSGRVSFLRRRPLRARRRPRRRASA